MEIRPYKPTDWDEWLRMNLALFPGMNLEADEAEMRATIARTDAQVFVLDRGDGKLAGYVEVGERSIADGCESSPVGYIEAWYVDPDVRRSGHGRSLLIAAEEWAMKRGRTEMASDALIDNDVSHAAHKSSGYEEVDRVITYRKTLSAVSKAANIRQAVPFFWVSNIQRSIQFYVDGLGAKLTNMWIDNGKLRWCWLELQETALMLQEFLPDSPLAKEKLGSGLQITYVCADAIAYYKEVTSRGLDADTPFVGNSMWVTGVTDPDGYRLFFESPTDAPEESEYSAD
jgi:GNAT superfamily N-acetyltransferase/catechol 2,3-dioxygenase-like lactoylglutathione lyase family enzyme